jgi:anti-anti-sigma factor
MMANEDRSASSPSDSSSDLLSVSRVRRGSAVVVRFVGEIDLLSVGSVRTALTAALAEVTAPHPIVLDLTGVGFLASAGLAELQTAHERAADQHTPLRIVATGRPVLRPLEVTGMAATLDIRADITTALAPLDSRSPQGDESAG